MSVFRQVFEVRTQGRGTQSLTQRVQRIVADSGIQEGLCTIFIHHTSASLVICENADPSVRRDVAMFFARLVPDGDAAFEHTAEGPDDMSAHLRSMLTQTSIGIPVAGGRCDLGTWQGIYLFEHRYNPHTRRITAVVQG